MESSLGRASASGRGRLADDCRDYRTRVARLRAGVPPARETDPVDRLVSEVEPVRGALVKDGGSSSSPKALAPFAGSWVSTLTTIPLPTRGTERADFPHAALGRRRGPRQNRTFHLCSNRPSPTEGKSRFALPFSATPLTAGLPRPRSKDIPSPGGHPAARLGRFCSDLRWPTHALVALRESEGKRVIVPSVTLS